MKKHTGNPIGGQGSGQQPEVLADLCYRFVGPLLRELSSRMDRRLVQTLLDLLLVIVMHRHRNQGSDRDLSRGQKHGAADDARSRSITH